MQCIPPSAGAGVAGFAPKSPVKVGNSHHGFWAEPLLLAHVMPPTASELLESPLMVQPGRDVGLSYGCWDWRATMDR